MNAKNNNFKQARINKKLRPKTGGMLVLAAAVTIGISLVLLFFALNFTRLLGSNQEEKTAIESAALAAAKDLTQIVVNDPNFGYVSLSDYAPTGAATVAGDGYSTPVHGINTILGTIRLDMIIADQIGDPAMKALAQADYTNAMSAKDNLVTMLQASLAKTPPASVTIGGHAQPIADINGNPVTPYADALQAYQSSVVRMTGGQASLVQNSLALTLGCVVGVPTNIQTPTPSSVASISENQQLNGCYRAYMDASYDGDDFIFAGTTSNITLVNPSNFQVPSATSPYSISGLSYTIPSIVKAEATESVAMIGPGAGTAPRQVHTVACAEPACISIPAPPAPGALTISFPDGPGGGLANSLSDLINLSNGSVPVTVYNPPPGGGGQSTSMSGPAVPPPSVGNAMSQGAYDWIRRSGSTLDVSNITSAINGAGNYAFSQAPAGTTLVYNFTPSGNAVQVTPYVAPAATTTTIVNAAAANNQLYAYAQNAVGTNPNTYDIYMRDYVSQLGTMLGGATAGQPTITLPPATVAMIPSSNLIASSNTELGIDGQGSGSGAFRSGCSSGDISSFGSTCGKTASTGSSSCSGSHGSTPSSNSATGSASNSCKSGGTASPSAASAPVSTGGAAAIMPPTFLQPGLDVAIIVRISSKNPNNTNNMTHAQAAQYAQPLAPGQSLAAPGPITAPSSPATAKPVIYD